MVTVAKTQEERAVPQGCAGWQSCSTTTRLCFTSVQGVDSMGCVAAEACCSWILRARRRERPYVPQSPITPPHNSATSMPGGRA